MAELFENGSPGGGGDFKADGSVPMTGALDFGGKKGINAADPTAAQDVATKAYVDSHAGGSPGAKAEYTGGGIPTSTYTAAAWSVVDYDTSAFVNLGTHPTRFTIPTGLGGKYLLVVNFFQMSGTGGNIIAYKINGGTLILMGAAAGTIASSSEEVTLADGDYLEVFLFASAGGDGIGAGTRASIRKTA